MEWKETSKWTPPIGEPILGWFPKSDKCEVGHFNAVFALKSPLGSILYMSCVTSEMLIVPTYWAIVMPPTEGNPMTTATAPTTRVCPKCRATGVNLQYRQDVDGWYLICLPCGFTQDVPQPPKPRLKVTGTVLRYRGDSEVLVDTILTIYFKKHAGIYGYNKPQMVVLCPFCQQECRTSASFGWQRETYQYDSYFCPDNHSVKVLKDKEGCAYGWR